MSMADNAICSPVLSPEAILKPKAIKNDLVIWVGSHEEPENILYFMVRNILAHLQVFRNQMFVPMFMTNTNIPTIANLQPIGTAPSIDEVDDTEPLIILKELE